MYGFMRSKDGESSCSNCQGKGCHKCGGSGKIKQCPSCGARNDEIKKDGNDFECMQCHSRFDSAGNVSEIVEETKPKLKKKPKPKRRMLK